MTTRVVVLCWEECRPWVSQLRQNGYSVPWVEEPKGEVHKQIPDLHPDAVLIDLTRQPEQGREMVIDLASNEHLRETPLIVVSEKGSAARGLKSKVRNLIVASPSSIVLALEKALGPK
ncbi:MAG: hypothetical protein ACRDJ4_13055 [Actinomycetota bacterium]